MRETKLAQLAERKELKFVLKKGSKMVLFSCFCSGVLLLKKFSNTGVNTEAQR